MYLRELYAYSEPALDDSGNGLYALNGDGALEIFRARGRCPLEVRKRRRRVADERILIDGQSVLKCSRDVR